MENVKFVYVGKNWGASQAIHFAMKTKKKFFFRGSRNRDCGVSNFGQQFINDFNQITLRK